MSKHLWRSNAALCRHHLAFNTTHAIHRRLTRSTSAKLSSLCIKPLQAYDQCKMKYPTPFDALTCPLNDKPGPRFCWDDLSNYAVVSSLLWQRCRNATGCSGFPGRLGAPPAFYRSLHCVHTACTTYHTFPSVNLLCPALFLLCPTLSKT